MKFKTVECFRNIDHGLWHGKLIDELRRQMPRMFRQGQDLAESVSPPGGETIADARKRVCKALKKIFKKAEDDVVALVIPDPLASVIASMMQGKALEDLWEAECDGGKWESLDVAGALAMV